MTTATLEDWIEKLQAGGKYTFLRSEAVTESGLSAEAVKKALQRLARRRRIAKIKDYFYVIVPLEYLQAGATPASWFIHDLMTAMHLPYYVGLLTAAGLHGASHQQPQEFQVVTDRSVRPLLAGRTKIRFIASKYVANVSTTNIKTPTGSMRVSTPEATAVDLVRLPRIAGSLDYVATVVAELLPVLDAKRLAAAVRKIGDVPNAQRLGFLLDRVGARRLTGALRNWIQQQEVRPVPLMSGRPVTAAKEDKRWHILVNAQIEVEA